MTMTQKRPESAQQPPQHLCVFAMASGLALMVGAVPVVTWLVNQAFAAAH